MINSAGIVFEVEYTRQNAEDDGVQERTIRVLTPNADELADAIRDLGASMCPIAFEVADESIDYKLPKDRMALIQDLYNFKCGFS
jgi:hypothetical protein